MEIQKRNAAFKNDNVLNYLKITGYERVSDVLYKQDYSGSLYILTPPNSFTVRINGKRMQIEWPGEDDLDLIGKYLKKSRVGIILIKIEYINERLKNHMCCFIIRKNEWLFVNPYLYSGASKSETQLNKFIWRKIKSFKLALNRRIMTYKEFVFREAPV